MSNLLVYLNCNFGNPSNIEANFREQFGVSVKTEKGKYGDLYLFKYGITSKWNKEITHECRGSILKLVGPGSTHPWWSFVSRPFDKFFNLHEGNCPIFDDDEFTKRIGQCEIIEKADGSLIQLWYDTDQAKWRVSTSGIITPHNVQDENYTFEDMFWRVWDGHTDLLDRDFTHMFEICCEANRIVTRYKKDHLVYLTSRNTMSGSYCKFTELAITANVRLPISPTNTFTTKDELYEFIEKSSSDVETYGEYSEGFVLYEKGKPIAKLKNSKYLALHHVGGGDIAASKNKIVDAIFNEHLDDIRDFLSERLSKFAESVQEKIASFHVNFDKSHKSLVRQKFETQKDFALQVQAIVDSKLRGFFFQNKDMYLNKDDHDMSEMSDLFDKWLKSHYQKFNWKEE